MKEFSEMLKDHGLTHHQERAQNAVVESLEPVDREEAFDEMLREVSEPVRIGLLEYDPALVLKEVDPAAYRCGVNDYADGMDWVEVAGDVYGAEEVERALDDLAAEIEAEEEE